MLTSFSAKTQSGITKIHGIREILFRQGGCKLQCILEYVNVCENNSIKIMLILWWEKLHEKNGARSIIIL